MVSKHFYPQLFRLATCVSWCSL